jgi:hypothetical protein
VSLALSLRLYIFATSNFPSLSLSLYFLLSYSLSFFSRVALASLRSASKLQFVFADKWICIFLQELRACKTNIGFFFIQLCYHTKVLLLNCSFFQILFFYFPAVFLLYILFFNQSQLLIKIFKSYSLFEFLLVIGNYIYLTLCNVSYSY